MTAPPRHHPTHGDPGAAQDLAALAAALHERGHTTQLDTAPPPSLVITHPTVRHPQRIYAEHGFFRWNDPHDRRLAFCDREPGAIPHAARAAALLMTTASFLDHLDPQ